MREMTVGYNYLAGVDDAIKRVTENQDADVFYIQRNNVFNDPTLSTLSLSVNEAEEVVNRLNGLLYDFYEARKES